MISLYIGVFVLLLKFLLTLGNTKRCFSSTTTHCSASYEPSAYNEIKPCRIHAFATTWQPPTSRAPKQRRESPKHQHEIVLFWGKHKNERFSTSPPLYIKSSAAFELLLRLQSAALEQGRNRQNGTFEGTQRTPGDFPPDFAPF